MKVQRRYILILFGSVLLAAGIYLTGRELEYLRYSGDITEELMYFPSGRFLQFVAPGFKTALSDFLWLKGIQYYGEHRRTDKEYFLAEHIFATVTDFDPLFVGAYRFGAFVLAQDAGQPAAGIDLLRKGIRNNPDRWELPFDLGFLYFVTLKDHARAAQYFRFASGLPDAPEIVRRFTAFAYRKAGRTELALALWKEIYQLTDNEVIKETALSAMKNIIADQAAAALTELVSRFWDERGRYPAGLDELVTSGYTDSIPQEPFGGCYFLDHTSKMVLSTTRVSSQTEKMIRSLERALRIYYDRYGCYPESLGALVDAGLIETIPDVHGADVCYEPSTGRLGWKPLWKRGE